MIQKLKIDFSRFTDSGLLTKARQVLQDMTGNPAFANPIPTLADLGPAIDAYNAALVKAADLGRIHVAEKNKSRNSLELLLTQLGMYVMFVANGDAALLTSSGFDLAKGRESASLVNPGIVTLSNGLSSGELISTVKAVKGAKGYLHQYTPEPVTADSVWASNPSTRRKITFSGLEPGKKYAVRVLVMGKGEQVVNSPMASVFVQ